jgi:hypothetical protein
VLLTGPAEEFVPSHLQGTTLVAMAVLWAGEIGDGEDAVKAFRDLRPELDLVGPMPYSALQSMLDDPPGHHNYWTADYHDDFPDDALDVFVRYGLERKSPLAQQILLPWGGAVAAVADGATPLANRGVRWITHPFAVWDEPADSDANIAWARGYRRDIARHSNGGVYLNFIGEEGQAGSGPPSEPPTTSGWWRSRANGIPTTCSGATRTSRRRRSRIADRGVRNTLSRSDGGSAFSRDGDPTRSPSTGLRAASATRDSGFSPARCDQAEGTDLGAGGACEPHWPSPPM